MGNILIENGKVVGALGSQGGSGGGHTIQDSTGTDLTQRDALQFKGGLKVTDDSTNEKTVVDGTADEITWAEYNNLTPAQQSALDNTIVTDVPGADGTISADLMTKLWENPDPTASFAAQDITLSSDDYDFLLFVGGYSKDDTDRQFSVIASKGAGVVFSYSLKNIIRSRLIERVSDTSFSVGAGNNSSSGASPTTNNDICIPLAIYGIKKTVTLTFDALARDVSTSASKCMLSDEETSVEDAIDELNSDLTSNYYTKTAVDNRLHTTQFQHLNKNSITFTGTYVNEGITLLCSEALFGANPKLFMLSIGATTQSLTNIVGSSSATFSLDTTNKKYTVTVNTGQTGWQYLYIWTPFESALELKQTG